MKTPPRLRLLNAIFSIAIGGYVFFFFLPAAAAAGSAGEGVRFEVEGESAVKGLNRAGAAKSAVRNAFRKAVSQVAAEIMGKERFRRNRPAIENALLRQSDKFIRRYRVLSQSAPPSREKIKVRLEVNVDRSWVSDVLRSLRLMETKAEIVRVLFLVEERILGKRRRERGEPLPFETNEIGTAERRLLIRFAQAGYVPMDPRAQREPAAPGQIGAAVRGDINAARALGALCRCPIVITARAIAERQGDGAFAAFASARAIRTKDGRVLAFRSKQVRIRPTGRFQGHEAALTRAGDELAAALLSEVRRAHPPPRRVMSKPPAPKR